MIAFAAKDPAANSGSVGTIGYCMSGRFAVCAGGSRPDCVKATASIYGVRLVTGEETSPHLVAKQSPAEFYFACAERDHWAPQEMVDQMKRDLTNIIDFLQKLGLHLDDHYMQVRGLVDNV